MSHKCAGKKEKNAPCRMNVEFAGDYCRFHDHQKIVKNPCACTLTNGSNCPYPAVKNGYCEYHPEPNHCQGRTILGGSCLKAIPTGNYCWNCKRQEEIVTDSVKTAANNFRNFLSKDKPIITSPKMASVPAVFSPDTVVVPSEMKAIELEKPSDCCICQDEMTGPYGVTYRKLGCGHWFHLECISKCNSMTCPLCRAEIKRSYLPKWVIERMKENGKEREQERIQERTAATHQIIQEIVSNSELLDMNSSEEDDFNHYVETGAEMGLMATVDEHGHQRLALVVLSGSPPQ